MSLHWTRCMTGACFTKVYENQERCPRCFNPVQQRGKPLALVPVEPCDLSTFGTLCLIAGMCAAWQFEQDYGFNMKRERDFWWNKAETWERLHRETCERMEAMTKRGAA